MSGNEASADAKSTGPSSKTAELYARLLRDAEPEGPYLALQVGDTIPDFVATSTQGELDFAVTIDGLWSFLLILPHSFNPVHTTELAGLAKVYPELRQRKVQVITLTCDTITSLHQWKRETEELHDCKIEFPIVADADAAIAKSFGLVRHDATIAIRALVPASLAVFAAPTRSIEWYAQYPSTTGHNFEEILRVLEALQLAYDNRHIATGVNWMAGDDVFIVDGVSTAQAKATFPQGFIEIEPWFRLTPSPETAEDQGAASLDLVSDDNQRHRANDE